MPGTQPRGMHTFNPASSSSQSAMQLLNFVNTEEKGAEDQDLPLDSPMALFTPPDLSAFSTSSIISSLVPPAPSTSSSSSRTKPPPSLSLPPTVSGYPQPTQQHDISIGSMHSITTSSDAGSSQLQKCKRDARLASGIHPPSSKWSSTSKTNNLNPVVITTALNLTLNCMVDVMERTLDTTAITTAAPTTSIPSFPNITPSIESSQPLSALAPPEGILDQAIRIISGVNSHLTEDQLLLASLFFTSTLDDAICAACTVVALGNNQAVQHRFLLSQLSTLTLSGKGKGKALEDADDDFMVTV